MVTRSKAYRESAKLIDKTNTYASEDAIELAKKMAGRPTQTKMTKQQLKDFTKLKDKK